MAGDERPRRAAARAIGAMRRKSSIALSISQRTDNKTGSQ